LADLLALDLADDDRSLAAVSLPPNHLEQQFGGMIGEDGRCEVCAVR
jgi:hypothetical protein